MAVYTRVKWVPRVAKDLEKVPTHIARKFYIWVHAVELIGIRRVRESPGFHDEPLQGKRFGERSVRLNRSYRAIYRQKDVVAAILITVLEIHKHEY